MADFLNILSIVKNVHTLGPGNRMVIWVQGCPFSCKKCTTPEGIPLRVNKLISIEDLAKDIIKDNTITGLTFSGGEPFLQASKLVNLIELIKKERKELNYICFSGYNYKDLIWKEAKYLLENIDLLIDGEYIEEKNTNIGLRGSTNQNLIFLTDKLLKFKDELLRQPRGVDIRVRNKYIQAIGIPNREIKI